MNFKIFLLTVTLSVSFLHASEVDALNRFKKVQPFGRQDNLKKTRLEMRLQDLLDKHNLGGEILDPIIEVTINTFPKPNTQKVKVIGHRNFAQMTPKDFCAINGRDHENFIKVSKRHFAYSKALRAQFETGTLTEAEFAAEFKPVLTQLCGLYESELAQELRDIEQSKKDLEYFYKDFAAPSSNALSASRSPNLDID
jgi:hypothetical protein